MISSTADAPTSTNHHKSPLSPLIGLRLKRRQLPNLKPPSNDTEASSPSPTAPLSPVATSPTGEGESCRQFLLRRHAVEQVWSGPAPEDVPRLALGDIRPDIFASQTGPDSGHMLIHELKKGKCSLLLCSTDRACSAAERVLLGQGFRRSSSGEMLLARGHSLPVRDLLRRSQIIDLFANFSYCKGFIPRFSQ